MHFVKKQLKKRTSDREEKWQRENRVFQILILLSETYFWQTRRPLESSETRRRQRGEERQRLSLCSLWSFFFLGENKRTREEKSKWKERRHYPQCKCTWFFDKFTGSFVHSISVFFVCVCVCGLGLLQSCYHMKDKVIYVNVCPFHTR